eukprot:TRINITY_DN55213_c0_g1_i1.p1 TRINITY_DN55213_c0_g1~~TRINITY_DN55213_c0_g1_i1.p1  ORF type:complete len:514 (-),score=85.81 TRINITY_DN55213_c0_g1_i1:148-1689(-)
MPIVRALVPGTPHGGGRIASSLDCTSKIHASDPIAEHVKSTIVGTSHIVSAPQTLSRAEMYATGKIGVEGLARLEDHCDMSTATKLGCGSIGDVLLAYDRFRGEKVAVKVVSMEKLHRSGHNEVSLRREIEAMSAVSHPNIVCLFDVLYSVNQLKGATASPPYVCFVMKHISNSQPLSFMILNRGALPQLARQIIPQLADAVQELHSRGFVHRDLWSENVLVNAQGHAVIIDFGCAAQFASGPDVENRMNVPYMSPQATAGERQQPGDDCWTLGCLITEMATGNFIAVELGRCDVPLHSRPQTLQHVIHECHRMGGSDLGELAAGLLDRQVENRLTMRSVLSRMQANGTVPVCPRSPTLRKSQGRRVCLNVPKLDQNKSILLLSHGSTNSFASSASTAASTKDVVPLELRTGTGMVSSFSYTVSSSGSQSPGVQSIVDPLVSQRYPSTLVTISEPRLEPGTRVNYVARSHDAEYKATVVGRVPGRNAWRIRVECGGEKIVEENELWRLRRPPR